MKKIFYFLLLSLCFISCQKDNDVSSEPSVDIKKRAPCNNILSITPLESTPEGCCQWIVTASDSYLLQSEGGKFYFANENNEYFIVSCNDEITIYVVQYNPWTESYDAICNKTLSCDPCDQIAIEETTSATNCCNWTLTVPSGYSPQVNGGDLFTSGGGIYTISADCGEGVIVDLLQDGEIVCSKTFICDDLNITISSEFQDDCCIHTFEVSNPDCIVNAVYNGYPDSQTGVVPSFIWDPNPETGIFTATYCGESTDAQVRLVINQFGPCTTYSDYVEFDVCNPCNKIEYEETTSSESCCNWTLTVPSGYTPKINGNNLFTSGGGVYPISADCGEEVTVDLFFNEELICSKTFTCDELTITTNSVLQDECCIHTFVVSNPNCIVNAVYLGSPDSQTGDVPSFTWDPNPQTGIFTATYCGESTDAAIRLGINQFGPCTTYSEYVEFDDCQ